MVENMSFMFYACSSLTSLNLSNFDTNRVVNMNYMFGSCNSLQDLNVSNKFNIKNVKEMEQIFSDCQKLKTEHKKTQSW